MGLLQKKENNLGKFRESWSAKKTIVSNTPLMIFMELCNTCNISCKMCMTRGLGWPMNDRIMEKDVYESAYPLFENALALYPFGFGEPLLHRKFEEIVRRAKEKELYVSFFTNGLLLNERLAESLVDSGVDQIVVSLDGATKETYEAIHERSNFETVIKNCRKVHELKNRRHTKLPELSVHYIAMQSNFHEFQQLLKLAPSWGFNSVDLKPLVTYDFMPELNKEKRPYDPLRDSIFIQECAKIAAEQNIKLSLDQFLKAGTNDSRSLPYDELVSANKNKYIAACHGAPFCVEPFRTVYIKADGHVKPCCFHQDFEYLGNVHESSLPDIWNGEKFIEFRERMLRNEIPKACIPCIANFTKPPEDNSAFHFSRISKRVSVALICRKDEPQIPEAVGALQERPTNDNDTIEIATINIGSGHTPNSAAREDIPTLQVAETASSFIDIVLQKTKAPIICVLRHGVEPSAPDWYEKLISAFSFSPAVGIVLANEVPAFLTDDARGALPQRENATEDYLMIEPGQINAYPSLEDFQCFAFRREVFQDSTCKSAKLRTMRDTLTDMRQNGWKAVVSAKTSFNCPTHFDLKHTFVSSWRNGRESVGAAEDAIYRAIREEAVASTIRDLKIIGRATRISRKRIVRRWAAPILFFRLSLIVGRWSGRKYQRMIRNKGT